MPHVLVLRCDLSAPLHLRRDFQAQGVEPDEAGGVVLVAGFRRVGFHRGARDVAKVIHLGASSPLP